MFAMKKIVLFASVALCAGSMAFAAPLQSQQDKESYSMGASVGNYLSDQIFKQSELGASINMDLVVQGFEEALRNKSQLSDDDVLKFLNSRAEKLNKLYDAQKKKIAAENSAKAKDFLAKNAKKKGVTVTKSGLQYEVLKKGNVRNEGAGALCSHDGDSWPRRRHPLDGSRIALSLHDPCESCLRCGWRRTDSSRICAHLRA